MHLLTAELSEHSRVCSVPALSSSWSLGGASLVLLQPASAFAWRWRFFRLSFRVWMMSFTFPHGVLCVFWWGSFPVPVLPTPSYTLHHILHKPAYRKAKVMSTWLTIWSVTDHFTTKKCAPNQRKFWMIFVSLCENRNRVEIILFLS
jgi:hypothetical protein